MLPFITKDLFLPKSDIMYQDPHVASGQAGGQAGGQVGGQEENVAIDFIILAKWKKWYHQCILFDFKINTQEGVLFATSLWSNLIKIKN